MSTKTSWRDFMREPPRVIRCSRRPRWLGRSDMDCYAVVLLVALLAFALVVTGSIAWAVL